METATTPLAQSPVEIPAPMTPIVIGQYEKLKNDIVIAKKASEVAIFQYANPDGNRAARSYVFGLRKLKGAIDAARKNAKAVALDFGRRVDSLAKEMETDVVALIEPHQRELDKIENAEKDRKAAHEATIKGIIDVRVVPHDITVATLRRLIEQVQITDTSMMQEYRLNAEHEKGETLKQLGAALQQAEKHEAEAAELIRLRAEQAAAAQREREEQIRHNAEQAAREATEKAAREEANRIAKEHDYSLAKEREAKLQAERAAQEQVALAQARAQDAQRAQDALEKRNAELEQQAKAREAAAKKAHDEQVEHDRLVAKKVEQFKARAIEQITVDLKALKKAGRTATPKALATEIVEGALHYVEIDYTDMRL